MSEQPNRADEVVAKEFWDGFIARNKSIIVDLMYGQLKSTVTCLTCRNLSITFDPYLMISLPITRQFTLKIGYVPYSIYKEDVPSTITEISIVPDASSTVKDLK
jgi:ubiquitin C-terminal hydrolase